MGQYVQAHGSRKERKQTGSRQQEDTLGDSNQTPEVSPSNENFFRHNFVFKKNLFQ